MIDIYFEQVNTIFVFFVFYVL